MRLIPVIRLKALASVVALIALMVACWDGGPLDETSESDTGSEAKGVTLWTDTDASALCDPGVERVELATRRRNCWDPKLPCTIAQDPPWVVGTTLACDVVQSGVRWEVTVSQTGQWETWLQARLDGGVVEQTCVGAEGASRTNVGRADLEAGVEIQLAPTSSGDCG